MTHVTFLVPAKVQFLCKPTTSLPGSPQSAIRRIGSLPEHVALPDRTAHGANMGETHDAGHAASASALKNAAHQLGGVLFNSAIVVT